MFTVLDPLLEFTYHLLFSWRKFALCIQSLLCMLFLFWWPPCQRSDMILMEVSQHAYDMIHYISGLFGYFYVCEIYVNLIWYLYLFMLNKFCLSLSLSLVFCRQKYPIQTFHGQNQKKVYTRLYLNKLESIMRALSDALPTGHRAMVNPTLQLHFGCGGPLRR